MKKFGLGILLLLLLLVIALYIDPQINPNHDTPYLALQDEEEAPAPQESTIAQRLLLYGDAGYSTVEPWQPSLKMMAARAAVAPEKTSLVALGDNIYMSGFPILEDGVEAFDEDQLESISYLDAQLKVAKDSGATLFLVPGNHDWLALDVDGQAAYIAEWAQTHRAAVQFEPDEQPPLPQAVNLPGLSLVFLDSEWLMHEEQKKFEVALGALEQLLTGIRQQHPENLIVATAHHPLMTEGQHAGYLTHFSYWFMVKLLYTIFDVDQDIDHPTYKKMIDGLNTVFGKFDKLIYAAGHDHSLQLFRPPEGTGPTYQIVSGAGNSNKISGVWHNDFSRFALSQEGFMELNITHDGRVHFSVYDIHHDQPVAGFWLVF